MIITVVDPHRRADRPLETATLVERHSVLVGQNGMLMKALVTLKQVSHQFPPDSFPLVVRVNNDVRIVNHEESV